MKQPDQDSTSMKMPHKIVSAVMLLALLLSACQGKGPSAYQKSRTMMDTFVTITAVSGSKPQAEKAIDRAFEKMEDFGRKVSFYSEASELSEINRNAGLIPVKVSAETFDVIEKALYMAEKSGGAFDPTIGAVMRIWDFKKGIKPQDSEIRQNLKLVGYRLVKLNRAESSVFLTKKGVLLDMGGIAKGYAADLGAEILKQEGITGGIVAAAGDIVTFGTRADSRPWNVGIRNPRSTGGKDEIIAKLQMFGRAVSTAGDYERFFMQDGKRFHHILDPATGYPAGACRSVSLVANKGVWADGLDNAVFVLGPVKGLMLLENLKHEITADALIIDGEGNRHTSSGMNRMINNEKSR